MAAAGARFVLGATPRPHRRLHCQLDYFRLRRDSGLDRLSIGYTELNQANAPINRR